MVDHPAEYSTSISTFNGINVTRRCRVSTIFWHMEYVSTDFIKYFGDFWRLVKHI